MIFVLEQEAAKTNVYKCIICISCEMSVLVNAVLSMDLIKQWTACKLKTTQLLYKVKSYIVY